MSQRLPAWHMLAVTPRHWSVENHLHHQLDVVFRKDEARGCKDHAPDNLSVIRGMALDMLPAHLVPRFIAWKMNLARWVSVARIPRPWRGYAELTTPDFSAAQLQGNSL